MFAVFCYILTLFVQMCMYVYYQEHVSPYKLPILRLQESTTTALNSVDLCVSSKLACMGISPRPTQLAESAKEISFPNNPLLACFEQRVASKANDGRFGPRKARSSLLYVMVFPFPDQHIDLYTLCKTCAHQSSTGTPFTETIKDYHIYNQLAHFYAW